MESIDAHQMQHIMVDFRFRKSRWQMNGKAVHFRLEHASSSESSAIRALDVAKVLFMLVSTGTRTRLRAERRWQRTRAGTPSEPGEDRGSAK
jgi:hypothetical protein